MIIDSDDENQTPVEIDGPDDSSFDAQNDPSNTRGSIIQTLDLYLGTDVLQISCLRLPANADRSILDSLPRLVSEKILIVLACSDFSVRLLTIPINPPSNEKKARSELKKDLSLATCGRGFWGETMIVLSSGVQHKSASQGVTVAVTPHSFELSDETFRGHYESDNETKQRTMSRSKSRSRTRRPSSDNFEWDLLVAANFTDASGLLMIYRIPFTSNSLDLDSNPKLRLPWRVQHLSSPAQAIEFNSSLFPASRHSAILIAERQGIVRVLDCQPQVNTETNAWLVSLYTEFETNEDGIPRRKQILGATWTLGGKAIAVLLSNGQWGIWDLEGVGPKRSPSDNAPSLAARLTTFSLGGLVSSSLSRDSSKASKTNTQRFSRLAPMTPGTRKMRQETLFTSTSPTRQGQGSSLGGLSAFPADKGFHGRRDDESLLFWHGDCVVVIQSLLTYWQRVLRESGDVFGSNARTHLRELNNVKVKGEIKNTVSAMPKLHPSQSIAPVTLPDSILVTGEYCLVIIAPPITKAKKVVQAEHGRGSLSGVQHLLARRELDVDGIDQLLDEM